MIVHLPQGLSLLATTLLAVYLGMFLLGRGPATLRLGRVGWMLLAVAVFWALAAGLAQGTDATKTLLLLAVLAAIALALVGARRVWIFRVQRDELLDSLRAACQRLFLQCQENTTKRLLLIDSGNRARHLQFLSLGRRFVLVSLPPRGERDKVALLLSWLSKQFPGPIPRIRVVLKEGQS